MAEERRFSSFVLLGFFLIQIYFGSSTDDAWKMVVEFARVQEWDNMIFIIPNENSNGILATSDVLHIFFSVRETVFINKVNWDSNISDRNGSVDLNLADPHYRKQFVCYWDSSLITYLQNAGINGFFSSQQEWLILLESDQMRDLKLSLIHIPFYIDSEVTLAQYDAEKMMWHLFEIWRSGPGAEINENSIGYWSVESELQLKVLLNKYDRRKDMNGFHIRVATIMTMPYESLLEDKALQNFDRGYIVDIWKTLQEQLNFSYTAENTLFGSLQKDGVTWNGMVGMLQNDEADVAAAPLSITRIRSFAIDFTIPVQTVSTRLYIRRPVRGATWALYSLPFEWDLWVCLPSFVAFSAFWLWTLNKLSMYFETDAGHISRFEALWAMFAGLVQQASPVEPKPFSSKIMFVTGFLSSLILFTCYGAILVSILTTLKPNFPFRNFEDLRQVSEWDVGVRTNTALADALALSPKGSPERDAWDHRVSRNPQRNLPSSNDVALKYVIEGNYAFFANKEYIIYRLQNALPLKDAMNIIDTGQDFLVRGIGFGVQKRSPFKNIFNYYLSRMTWSGHLDRLKRKWWPQIKQEPDSEYPSPGLSEVFTVFLIFGSGLALSLIFLGLEIFRWSNFEENEMTFKNLDKSDNQPYGSG